MKLLNIITTSVFQIFSLIFVLAYLVGVLNLYFSDKNNYCIMTYMFEYPQFVRLNVVENKIYPHYGLYAYSEGRFTEKARKMWFDGVPVLFLPGNSGSQMQARSLASVALRKALSQGYDFHFDFFTISYNEELSGLYGGVLQSQTRFAAASISKILSLYKDNKYTKSVPTTVILIGHSMGGLIAKRLLAYPSTINVTNIAISLAAPLEAPVINFDVKMNDYYMIMNYEWESYINSNKELKDKKILLSFGNGPRDVLMPSGLTSSNDSYISALTTSIPGVWVSPDHVCIVWCKQLVMAVNRFLFSIIDPTTEQVVQDSHILLARAKQYFEANRSIILSPGIERANVTMMADAFWYEDNRRIYQISRPEIDKTTYLMIRLVKFPQNRFVAAEAVNVSGKDWIFGCNAKYTYNTYRYCKHATSLSELSRWTGAATDFGKRKLATVHLHSLMLQYPEWTHVIIRIPPTRKPITLNVDINDHASREIIVDLPSEFSFTKSIIIKETERDSLYYELILRDFNTLSQAYLLYVEPTADCKANQYHVSAELHVPWAKNHEYYHYFTHIKRSPMNLRLFKSNPNVTYGLDAKEHVKITLLLDPQCTFTVSLSKAWYIRLAQFARNYTPALIPYVAAIVLLAVRSNIVSLRERGTCISIHSALMSEGVKPYYALVFARLLAMVLTSIPFLSFLFENASWKNIEIQYFIRSLLVLPVYMTALGIINIAAAAVLIAMVFSSQITHKLFFRIVWRGGSNVAAKVASGLEKIPMVVSVALICASQLSCGAASLVAGAAFYAFMLSKMYEDYLEDYVYKLMAKITSRICRFLNIKSNKVNRSRRIKKSNLSTDITEDSLETPKDSDLASQENVSIENITETAKPELISDTAKEPEIEKCDESNEKKSDDSVDEELNKLNFHMMLFFMWLSVTLVNVPALLTWARNFKYSMVLTPDTSYHTGLIMSICSTYIWQMDKPKIHLKYYDALSALLFTMAVFILALGPLSLTIVNYGVTFMFLVITVQQLFDVEVDENKCDKVPQQNIQNDEDSCVDRQAMVKTSNASKDKEDIENESEQSNEGASNINAPDECDPCNESRIYNMFKRLREKFSFADET